jgi:membrane glycosyltransferase
MAYASAMLWFAFLVLSTAEVAVETLVPPNYFPNKPSLFPVWPQWHPDWAITLVVSTAVLLFLPKALSIVWAVIGDRRVRQFGGISRLVASVIFETVIASLLAPIRMLFHGKFVFMTLIGRKVKWGSQTRGDAQTGWVEALAYHGSATVLALAWAGGVYWLNPAFLWWLMPVVGALILSIPLSVYTSRRSLGHWAYRRGLFLIPEEVSPPREIQWVNDTLRIGRMPPALPDSDDGFVRAVVEPYTNALHVALSPHKPDGSSARSERLAKLRAEALAGGPASLNRRERADLLADANSMADLHAEVWRLPRSAAAERWGLTAAPTE